MELILIIVVLVLLFGGGGGYWGRSRGYWWPYASVRAACAIPDWCDLLRFAWSGYQSPSAPMSSYMCKKRRCHPANAFARLAQTIRLKRRDPALRLRVG